MHLAVMGNINDALVVVKNACQVGEVRMVGDQQRKLAQWPGFFGSDVNNSSLFILVSLLICYCISFLSQPLLTNQVCLHFFHMMLIVSGLWANSLQSKCLTVSYVSLAVVGVATSAVEVLVGVRWFGMTGDWVCGYEHTANSLGNNQPWIKN